jgi:hypothetical protein
MHVLGKKITTKKKKFDKSRGEKIKARMGHFLKVVL